MLKVQAAASWTSGTRSTQTVLQSELCLSEAVQTASLSHISLINSLMSYVYSQPRLSHLSFLILVWCLGFTTDTMFWFLPFRNKLFSIKKMLGSIN